MEFLPTMHVHSAIGLQLLALPSTLILCFTSMLRERSIGDRDEERLVRLYKQHAFVLELVQLFVTLMAFGFATGNTMAAFEARSLVIDYASEEVTRMIVKSALVRDVWLLGSAVCILACVNMLDSWSLPESMEDLTDPLFRLTRTLIGACTYAGVLSIQQFANPQETDIGPCRTDDEEQFFFCDEGTFTEDLERSCCSKKSTLTHSLADLPTKKPTSEASDSDETITQPQAAIKPTMNCASRPATRNTSKPIPLASFPRLHPVVQNPSSSPSPAKKAPPPHYQDQTMSSSIRSSTSSTSFTSLASSTSFASSLFNSTSNISSASSASSAKPPQHSSPKFSNPTKPSLSRISSFKKNTSRPAASTSKKVQANDKKKLTYRARKRSVTFDLKPAVFPQADGGEGGGIVAVSPNDDEREEEQRNHNDDDGDEEAKQDIQTGVVRERVRELEELEESISSGEFEVEKQQRQQQQQQQQQFAVERRSNPNDDDDDDSGHDDGDDWEEESSHPNDFQENVENDEAAALICAEEEEALVRKQRPNNVARRESGNSES